MKPEIIRMAKRMGNQGGQRKVVPRGKIPIELVGVKDSHYTITPITDATGILRFLTVIFAAKEVSPEWSLGILKKGVGI